MNKIVWWLIINLMSLDSLSSDEDEFKDYYQNPLKRKQYDSIKLQQQQNEIFRMAGYNSQMAQAMAERIQKNHTNMVNQNRNYASVSLCGCTVTNPIREFVIKIVVNPWFDRTIITFILANSVVLALDDPFNPNIWFQNSDYVFLSVFTIEMILKIIAMGFIMRPYSYLRDPWNVLDCVVIILGWTGAFLQGSNVNAIRAIRILRPLRTINTMPGMVGLVKTLLNSLPQMVNIMILFFVFMIVAATVGVQLFQGDFLYRCALTSSIPLPPIDNTTSNITNSSSPSIGNQTLDLRYLNSDLRWLNEQQSSIEQSVQSVWDNLASMIEKPVTPASEAWDQVETISQEKAERDEAALVPDQPEIQLLLDQDDAEVFCQIETADSCPSDYSCIYWGNPNFGLSNWDNILFGTLMTFEIIGLEGWSDNMYQVRRSSGNVFFDTYFLVTVIFGAFFVMNLLIAVQFDFLQRAFTETDQQQAEKKAKDQEEDRLAKEQNQGKELPKKGFQRFLQVCKIDKCMERCQKCEPPKCCRTSQAKLLKVVEHDVFQYICLLIIMLNTLTLASEHYEQPEWLQQVQDISNDIFSLLFVIEGLLRFMAQGPTVFFKDGFNIFDTIVNLFSILDFLKIGPSFVVLRGFRLLRIFKVVRSMPGLRALLETILKSMGAIFNLGILIFMFVLIYALLGKSFFYEEMTESDGSRSRYQFDNVSNATMLIFIILSSENWNSIMRIVVHSHGYFGVAFCTSAMVIGNFMLLNLFLAILLKYIDDKAEDTKEDLKTQKQKTKDSDELKKLKQEEHLENLDGQMSGSFEEDSQDDEQEDGSQDEAEIGADEGSDQNISNSNPDPAAGQQSLSPVPLDMPVAGDNNPNKQQDTARNREDAPQKEDKKKRERGEIQLVGNSLLLISPDSKPRIWISMVLKHPYFETFIFHFIALNSLMLIVDEPVLKDPYAKKVIEYMSIVLSGIFILECLAKIFVMGFCCGTYTYLREGFNVLDFLIVLISISDFVFDSVDSGIDISYLRAFRALRALRPLKLVSKNEGMRLIVNSLLNSIYGIGNVMLISVLFYTVYGILGVQFLKGRISTCSNPAFDTKDQCLMNDYEWELPPQHYNNFLSSMLTFYEVSTLEMWPDIMFQALDSANDIDQARSLNNRPYIGIIFVTFIFITTFFVMNLFISVIVNKFNEEKEKTEGVAGLSEDQKEWVKIQRYLAEVVVPVIPVEPEAKFRKFVFNLVQSQFFEGIVQSVIMANTVTLIISHHGSSETFNTTISILNIIFVAFFILECMLKIIGYGFTYYFSQSSNQFDFVIVVLSLVSIDESISEYFNMTVFRIIRVARLLRMVKASKSLQALLKTLYLALQNIFNVGLLFTLIIFTFAVASMNLFGDIEKGELGFVNSHANFRTFYSAMITLFRASTGESWNGIMHDCKETGPVGYLFWVFFLLISSFIFVNVFIAVIYEEFKNVQHTNETTDVLSLKRRDICNFLNTWSQLNPQGQHFMKTTELQKFMEELPPPLGFKGQKLEGTKLLKIIYCLNIRDHSGYVYFPEVMWSIFYSVIGNNDRGLSDCVQIKQIMNKVKNKYKMLDRDVTLNSLCGNKFWHTEITVTKYLCGITILKNMRILMQRKHQREGVASPAGLEGEAAQVDKLEKVDAPKAKQPNFFKRLHLAVSRKNQDVTQGKTSEDLAKNRRRSTKKRDKKRPQTRKSNKDIQKDATNKSKSTALQNGSESMEHRADMSGSARGLLPMQASSRKEEPVNPNQVSIEMAQQNQAEIVSGPGNFTDALEDKRQNEEELKKQGTGQSSAKSGSILRSSSIKSRPRSAGGNSRLIQFS